MSATTVSPWRELHDHATVRKHATQLQTQGRFLSAYAAKVTAYYSYAIEPVGFTGKLLCFWNFARARHYVERVLQQAKVETLDELSAAECKTVGMLLLSKRLWWEADPLKAMSFFEAGLVHPAVPVHLQALILIGMAKAQYILPDKESDKESRRLVVRALALQEELPKDAAHPSEAHKQFARVLRKALDLSKHLPPPDVVLEADPDAMPSPQDLCLRAYRFTQEWGSQTQRQQLLDTAVGMELDYLINFERMSTGEALE